jgi:transposase
MSDVTALVPVSRFTPEQLLQEPLRLLLEFFHQRQQSGFWRAQYQRGKQRETELEHENRALRARVAQLEHQLFGKKSEKKNRSEQSSSPGGGKRPRGQQPQNPGPRHRPHDHLPQVEEPHDLPEDQQHCPQCGLPYEPFPGTEDSETLEIEVHAHRRVIRRRRYRPTCHCPGRAGIITAPPPAKLIPKGRYGISVWVQVLLDKFLFFRPSQRLIADLATHGLQLPAGTLAGGLKRITPLLEGLYEAIRQHCQAAGHWHADETGWKVFVKLEEKPGHKRTLWVYCSREAVFFAIALTRGAKEPEVFFGPQAVGILSVDRHSSYKALVAVKAGTLLLAFCWAHTRRDFLDAARGDPQQQAWVERWVERIGELFHLNGLRVAAWEQEPHGAAFAQVDGTLRAKLEAFRQACDEELQAERLPAVRKKVLSSVVNHWDGLTVFVEHPEVPLDNSEAERRLRGPAMGRKNYWGSGAVWAGELAERCFSLFATLLLAGLNVRTWLTAYLTACAEAGGRAPACPERWLPWNLSEQQRQVLAQPLQGNALPGELRGCLDALAEPAASSSLSQNVPGPPSPSGEWPTASNEPPPIVQRPAGELSPVCAMPPLAASACLRTPPPSPAGERPTVTNEPPPIAQRPAGELSPACAMPPLAASARRVRHPPASTTAPPPPVAKPPPSATCSRRRPLTFPRNYSGRSFSNEEIQQLRAVIAAAPHASRVAISQEVCRCLDWRRPDGRLKEMSCRVALLRMQEDGLLSLPPPRNGNRNGRPVVARTAAAEPQPWQEFSLSELAPLRLEIVSPRQSALWNEYLDRYHYLGYAPLAGAQLRYWAYAGQRLLALFAYGAAAWRLKPRDCWIGWDDARRQARLCHVVGQARFLILPWIGCRHLASKLLSLSAAQLPQDWEQRYGIRPWLLESFVDASRFRGTCYRAANWIDVGQTQGRGKTDRHRRVCLSRKQIYLYPLCRNCRQRLCSE